MAHLQYLPGDPRLVDQLVCELKSKGIFDQFRKDCIADVDTRPAYQNLRQRVESSVATFLSRQIWKPDLNKNQLREKLRKHLLDANYLEQGVERIVDQVVNPKVASVFIPQVEELVYNYLGIPRKKTVETAETSNGKVSVNNDLLPTDLEAVSPGSVKSNDDKTEVMDTTENKLEKIEVDNETIVIKDDSTIESIGKDKEESRLSGISELTIHDSDSVSIDKSTIPLPAEEIKLENIPTPENSPPNKKIDLEKIDLPKEPNVSTDIPLPDEIPKAERESYFNPMTMQSEDDETSSDSSLRRNMSPLTPIRNFNNENSCDAQQAFENDSDNKTDEKKEPSSFRFTIEKAENSSEEVETEKKDTEPTLPYKINNQVNVHTFNTPLYEDSSNSNNLQIDYESDVNSKTADIKLPEGDQTSQDWSKKDKKDEKSQRSSHKSSYRSRDSSRHSSSKDKRSDSKHSSSRDGSKQSKDDKKSKDEKSRSSHKERQSDRGDKKDSRDSSKHRSSSTHKSSSSKDKDKDSKHRSSTSSRHSSSKTDDKKSSSSKEKEKEKSDKSSSSKDKKDSKDRDSKSSSSKSDKDRKSSSKSKDDKNKENKERKEKKPTDDHYGLSGRGNPNRRSTDRDSNDGSSSSKGFQNPSNSRTSESKKENKGTAKSDNNSNSGDSTSPSDGIVVTDAKNMSQNKAIRVDTRLKVPVSSPPRLPFVPDVTIKKPRFAANLAEAKKMIKMRKFLEEEQKRMNQEAALLLEFQANVRPSLSQVYSSIPGPELEFACMSNSIQPTQSQIIILEEDNTPQESVPENTVSESEHMEGMAKVEIVESHDAIAETLIAMHQDGNVNMEQYESNVAKEVPVEFVDQSADNVIETLCSEEIKLKVENDSIEEVSIDIENRDLVKQELVNENVISIVEEKDITVVEENNVIEVKLLSDIAGDTVKTPEISDKEIKDVKEVECLKYFGEEEKFNAELERDKFNKFFKQYSENVINKVYLVNCDTYEENLIREAAQSFGQVEVVNYIKNGHLKIPKATKNIIKDVSLAAEITLPTTGDNKVIDSEIQSMSSPVKSECSFELSSDYDAKLEEMVNKTSRQEIMEIILGSAVEDSPTKMPEIEYCMDSSILNNNDNENELKRKITDFETTVDIIHVLSPKKLRKLSESDQITSTTEENVSTPNNNKPLNPRSKFLGKARRVGLPRPKRTTLPNSPSSDKSVENYEQNTAIAPNGKFKTTPRTKVQRYETSDLYKPKLHYLSRRNNIS